MCRESTCKVAVPAIRKWEWKSMELEAKRGQSLIITCLIHVWQSDRLNDQRFWAPFRIRSKNGLINKSWLFDFLFLWLALTTRNAVSAAKPVQETGRILRRLSPAWTLLCFTAQQNCQPVNASNASMSMGAGVTAIIVIYTSKKCICGFRRMGSHLTIRILTSLDFTEW